MNIVRTDREIGDLEGWAVEGQAEGTHFSGMSYEDGILDTLRWLIGESDDAPHGD